MAARQEIFHYEPHPRLAELAATPPPKTDDERSGSTAPWPR